MKPLTKVFFPIIFTIITYCLIAQSNVLASETSENGLVQSNAKFEPKEEVIEGVVKSILEEKSIKPLGSDKEQLYQKMEILVTKGSIKDMNIILENGDIPMSNVIRYKVGEKLVIQYQRDGDGNSSYFISDYVRRDSLFVLLIIFIVLVLLIARLQGLSSLLGMGVSFIVIFKFVLPMIYKGTDPVQVSIVGALMIIPVTFFLSHGINKKTLVAMAGTLLSLILTGVLTGVFVDKAMLTGFASEEAGFLQAYKPGLINIKGLLIGGIIIGVLGVLDDITISQSAIVQQLKSANPDIKLTELYKRSMSVGKDHIASMVNTLILVYTGASLPLLLIFVDNSSPFLEIINYEIIADEIIRTLVGSIGLITAVPITTIIAVLVAKNDTKKNIAIDKLK